MADTFYRFHWADCPEFNADNAWSGLWGAERSEDGSQTRCPCEGNGEYLDCTRCSEGYDSDPSCSVCGGECIYVGCELCNLTGWQPCVRGYSCEATPNALVRYFKDRAAPADEDGKVLVFEGEWISNGFDGEPTVVPTRVIETLSWSEFASKYAGALR